MTTTPTYTLTSGALASDPGLNRLYDNVQAQVPAVTLSLLKIEAWNTIEDFYLRSTAQRKLLDWTMAAGVSSIDFNPFDETWLVAWILGVSGLTNYQITPPALLEDLSAPAATRTGRVLLALKPVSFAAFSDPLLFQQWFEVILDGVFARLYRMPAKPWSNPQLAQFHGQKFQGGVARARDTANRGYGAGPSGWRVPYFAGGRRKN